MGALADALGGRIAGELIRADDWNALIEAVEGIETRLESSIDALAASVEERFGAVTTELAGLRTQVEDTATELAGVRGTLDALQGRFRRVTLRTDRLNHAIGEQVEIVAQITAIDGAALDLSDAAGRPWIDFVSSWGRFRAVSGFISRGGAEDRTVSVQVDAQGEARVLLRAETPERFTLEADNDVAATLTTRLPANADRSVAETILAAATPLEASLRGAFQTLSVEYDRPDSLSLRNYLDAYYVLNPSLITGRFTPTFQQSWRDYRATVTAIAKTDADPRTPDPSLGVCSIQVTFRDWIGPWVTLDYMANLDILADRYRDRLEPRVRENFAGSIGRIREEVTDILDGKGLLGRQRDYRAINMAVDRIGDGVPFRDDLVRSVTNAVSVQQTVEFAQVAAIGVEDPTAAFSFLSDTATRADTQVAAAQGRIEERVQDQVLQQQQSFRDELFRADGTLMVLQSRVNSVESSVGGFEEALSQKINLREFERLIPNII